MIQKIFLSIGPDTKWNYGDRPIEYDEAEGKWRDEETKEIVHPDKLTLRPVPLATCIGSINVVANLKDEAVYWGTRFGYNDPRSPFFTFCDRIAEDDAGICWRYHMTGCPVDTKDLGDITGRKEPHAVHDYST